MLLWYFIFYLFLVLYNTNDNPVNNLRKGLVNISVLGLRKGFHEVVSTCDYLDEEQKQCCRTDGMCTTPCGAKSLEADIAAMLKDNSDLPLAEYYSVL